MDGTELELMRCSVCGFVYDPSRGLPEEGIPPGTEWEDLPDDWVCPDCGMSKAGFKMEAMARGTLDY